MSIARELALKSLGNLKLALGVPTKRSAQAGKHRKRTLLLRKLARNWRESKMSYLYCLAKEESERVLSAHS